MASSQGIITGVTGLYRRSVAAGVDSRLDIQMSSVLFKQNTSAAVTYVLLFGCMKRLTLELENRRSPRITEMTRRGELRRVASASSD